MWEVEGLLHIANKEFWGNIPEELTELDESVEWLDCSKCDQLGDIEYLFIDSKDKTGLEARVKNMAKVLAEQLTGSYNLRKERVPETKPVPYNMPIRLAGVRSKGAAYLRFSQCGTAIRMEWSIKLNPRTPITATTGGTT